MLSDDEILNILERLLGLTQASRLQWQPFQGAEVDPHECMVSLQDFLFYISSSDGDGLPPVKFEVYKSGIPKDINPVGLFISPIEAESDTQARASAKAWSLYQVAWPQAFGVANVFDELDNALKEVERRSR